MTQIIDRRPNGRNKSAVNRRRFLERFKHQIKKAVSDAVSGRSITDIDSGEKISIPTRDVSEPTFRHGQGGSREIIHPGNEEFGRGDRIKRPPSEQGGGGGSKASNSGEGEDDFGFELSRKEFLELFFEDLELPDLVKRQITKIDAFKWIRAGFSADGVPANINVVRSLRCALGRRLALRAPYNKKLKELEDKLKALLEETVEDDERVIALREEIIKARQKVHAIPFIDTFDLRYNHRIKHPFPSTQAVMFCLMDVSGSMDETKKDVAKRFFILLYLFLTRTYSKIEVVFIRHHTSAKEVDEQEFFYSRETGGTVVSSALEKMHEIMCKRYPTSEWNIYAAQASDGDNWNNDSPHCQELLIEKIVPRTQYFAYVEILPRHHQSLWEAYLNVREQCDNFAMQHIESVSDIYPVFRELFKRKEA